MSLRLLLCLCADREMPVLGPVTEQLQSRTELPARPQSPFQEFLHVLIEGNSDSSADEHMLTASLQQEEQAQQTQQHEQGHEEEEREERKQQQQEQPESGLGGDSVAEATSVSGAVLPVADGAVKRTAREVQSKRASCAGASAGKPGELQLDTTGRIGVDSRAFCRVVA